MALPSPGELFLVIGVVVFTLGGLIAYYRSSVTVDLAFVLVLLAITCGLIGVTGVSALHIDAQKYDYTVKETSLDNCDSEELSKFDEYSNYSELSSEAQDVFRSALQANGEYTTTSHPDDFRLQTDVGSVNYIQYEATCYELAAASRGGLGYGILLGYYVIIATIGALLASASLILGRSREPIPILVGLGSGGGLVYASVIDFGQLAAATVLIGALAWVVLQAIVKYRHQSSNERIEM